MALLQSRVLTSLARRGFFVDNSAAVGVPGETDVPQATLDEINLRSKGQGTEKKVKAEKVDCDDMVCVIKSWKNDKNSSG